VWEVRRADEEKSFLFRVPQIFPPAGTQINIHYQLMGMRPASPKAGSSG
jgi:hypothetical protein